MKKVYLKTPEAVIKALKDGKVVYEENCPDYSFKLIENIIVAKYEDFFEVGSMVSTGNKPYILEEEPFKLEVGKFYKTREGRKAWVVSYKQGLNYPYIVAVLGHEETYTVLENGYFSFENHSHKDLIAPWECDN